MCLRFLLWLTDCTRFFLERMQSFFIGDFMKKTNFAGIDIVRILCAFLIICIHVAPIESFNIQLNSLVVNYLSRIGVPFFFICSGFFLFGKVDFQNPDLKPVYKYSIKLIKLYLIWNLLYLPLSFAGVFDYHSVDIFIDCLKVFILNMLFTSGFGHLWYLPATVVSVLIVGFLLKRKASFKVILSLALFLYIIGLFGQSYLHLLDPLLKNKTIYNFLFVYKEIFKTTRNGIFEGFIFVGLGAWYSQKRENLISFKASAIGFAVSMAFLLAEFAAVSKLRLRYSDGYDMYLFLVPAAFFLFTAAASANIKSNAFTKNLRTLSALIYYEHMFFVVLIAYDLIEKGMASIVIYLIVVALSVLLGEIIIFVSNRKHFSFVKNLYS